MIRLLVGIVALLILLVGCSTPVSLPADAVLGDTWVRPGDGMAMIYVPEGEFLMGSEDDDNSADNDEKPQHTVYLDAFWMV